MPLRYQAFILIGLIYSSEDNRSQLTKPLGNGTLHAKEKRSISQLVPWAEQGCGHRAHAECTSLSSPLIPRTISLCTVPWTHRPPLISKISLLSSLGGQKKKALKTSTLQKSKCPKMANQTILLVQLFKITLKHRIHHEDDLS